MTHLGSGLTNAVTGEANAALDAIPMVVVAGDVPSYYYGKHPHREELKFLRIVKKFGMLFEGVT